MSGLRSIFPEAKYILLDTNILVLLIAGQVRPNLLPLLTSGNIGFGIDDFEVLRTAILQFEGAVTTPYILAEVNTSLTQLDNNSRAECREQLAEYIPTLLNQYSEPKVLAGDPLFSAFGIADISILHASEHALVLTEDGNLIGLLQKSRTVLNYHTLKQVIKEQ